MHKSTESLSVPEHNTQRQSTEMLVEEPLDQSNKSVEATPDPQDQKRANRRYALLQLRSFATMLLIDVGLPLALYYALKNYVGVLVALVISGIPPLLRVIYIFWRRRRIDALGCIFVVSFVVSGVLTLITGDVRAALLRDSTVTALISIMFLVTLIPIHTRWFTNRPLTFVIAQQMMSELPPVEWTDQSGEKHTVARTEWLWQEVRPFRRHCYLLTFLWGFFLMAEFVIRVIMIEATTLTTDQIVLYGNIIVLVVVVGMTTFSIFSSIRLRKISLKIAEEKRKQNEIA